MWAAAVTRDPWLPRGGASQLLFLVSVDFAGSGSLSSG